MKGLIVGRFSRVDRDVDRPSAFLPIVEQKLLRE
jgi:hypothetical protein